MGWATITLADRTGAPLLDLLHPFGPAPPAREDEREDAKAVVAAGAPAVSEAFRESPAGPWLIAVRVPVVRDKSVRAVLSGPGTRAYAVVSYEQAVAPFLKTDRLSDSERAMLMGGACAKAYGWSPTKG